MRKHRVLKVGACSAVALFGVVFVWLYLKSPVQYGGPTSHPTPMSTPSNVTRSESRVGTVFAQDDNSDSPWRTETRHELVVTGSSNKPSKRSASNERYITINNKEYPLRTYKMFALPNDPTANQWWVASATVDSAWEVPNGSYQTTLAVIDTGFALDHEEFTGRWHQNIAETGAATLEGSSRLNCTDRGLSLAYNCNLVDDDVDGIVDNETGTAPYENPSQLNCTDQGRPLLKSCNRLDDDGNTYVDDVNGWDVINQDASVQAGELSPAGSGTTHGTMVSGAAAATGNNAKGIAGVNWQTKILPIQALDDDGYGNTKSVGEAIFYAVDQNADVINISLGTEFQDDYVREAIEAATAAGITVIAASGNDGCDCVAYPARYPEVVAVGATDMNGAKTGFSSWGDSVDIVAPGSAFTLPSWSSTNTTSRYATGVSGTSFASPLVAGAAALIKSHQPDAKPLHIIAALHQTTDRTRLDTSSIRSQYYGYGALDVMSARSRFTVSQHLQQVYSFAPIAVGGYFSPQPLTEASGRYMVQDCTFSRAGIPLYELSSGSGSFFTISEVEARRAVNLGYVQRLFSYACMQQPHDTVDIVRSINIFREFKNISVKP